MNSALPPPVLIGTNRPSAFETCSVHGRIGSREGEREDRRAATGPRREQRDARRRRG